MPSRMRGWFETGTAPRLCDMGSCIWGMTSRTGNRRVSSVIRWVNTTRTATVRSETLVVLSQNFKKGMPLVDGHGNLVPSRATGQRRCVTRRRVSRSLRIYLKDLDKTVRFVPNYDETEKEPEVLPVRVPNLLINGAEGIAVA